MSRELVILGSGNADPQPARAAAGYWLRAPCPVLFDLGPGALRNLVDAGVSPEEVRTLFLSHHHADHFADLIPLLFRLSWAREPGGLAIYGPSGTVALVDGLRRVIPHLRELRLPLDVRDVADGEIVLGDLRVRAYPVPHSDILTCVAFHVTWPGGSLAYSGDAAPSAALVEALRGVDVAVVEATFPGESASPKHLTARQAGRAAREAGVRCLVLTHFSPAWEGRDPAAEAALEFAGPIQAAEDLIRIPLD